jgi:hypothetical protein
VLLKIFFFLKFTQALKLITSVTCKSLKIENDSFKDQIKALKGDFQNLEKILRGFEMAADKGRHSCINEVEIQKYFEFYGKSYDDLNHFKDEANAELRKLKSLLNAIDSRNHSQFD